MPRKKKTQKSQGIKLLPMDKRIRKVLDDSWIAPLYFSEGITVLLNKFNAMSDEELTVYMERLVHPAIAREHVQEIYDRLNNVQ